MSRIVATSLVLVALVAGFVTSALATSRSASAPITKTEAVAFAQAVNLRPGDVPGAEPPHHEPNARSSLSKIVRCAHPGAVTARPVDEDGSIVFTHSDVEASLVRVMPTEAIAATELSAFASKRGHRCFARAAQVEASSEKEREASYPIKATFVRLVKLLGTGAIGVHTVSKLPHAPKAAVIHIDVVLFRVGPAEILFITAGNTQFAAATEGRLLSLLHGRAKAHKL